MATLLQFEQSMRQLADRVERRGPAIQRKVALEILRLVILGTPVGNKEIWMEPGKARVGYVGGRARANWFVGVGHAVTEKTETIDNSGQQTISAGESVIGSATAGSIIHLTNNLPYIVPLNQGHSHQAPQGFIERAVQGGAGIAGREHILEEGR